MILSYLFNKSRSTWHEKLYLSAIYLSYILFAIAYTGIIVLSPEYLQTLNSFIKYYVSLFLIIRFNPITNTTLAFSGFDRRIVFSSGMFLLLTTSAMQIAKRYLNNIINDNVISDQVIYEHA
jgi:hypothetical protein